jgi:hypothetical protein
LLGLGEGMMFLFIVFAVGMGLKLNIFNAKKIFAMVNQVIKLYPETDE